MTVKRERYISAKDIMQTLSVSKCKALQIMHMFGARGLLFKNGRVLRVKESDFAEWLRANGG